MGGALTWRDLSERSAGVATLFAHRGIAQGSVVCIQLPNCVAHVLSTLAAWRGRGIYRALVAVRARRAVARGVRYLQVDASDDSAPILRRLGFGAVTTTTPYVWTPPGARGRAGQDGVSGRR